ncbi:MAG: bifunctional homocysteine S-methyltransferase/methylenetetrahydrofolate reductase [Acidobacteriota bacterium]|nr:bifunctional homocysteine S-methyltransferase/methylenetetrahydrofolate reductase [Blastocatellia bacterium]MDW8411254.1 bifunctional homocysteine S-methyltransferase/methylenetetrahydrofolate reductase [Acidobacteriota bacterium]
MRELDLLSVLDREILIAEGAKTSIWQEQGLRPAEFIAQNITKPENVIALHLAYIAAGARIIETNTAYANRLQLARHNLEGSFRELNITGVRLAREAVKRSGKKGIFIAGAVGPLGALVKPYGNLTLTELGQLYQEQIELLYGAGVDLLVIENHPSLLETLEAVRAARNLDSRPIWAQMTFLQDGLSKFGDELRRSLEALAAADADIVGAHCGIGLSHMYNQMADFLRESKLRIAVKPNAGLPQHIDGREVYRTSPEYAAEYARKFAEAGAVIIGGCCGLGPEHIKAMATAVSGKQPRRHYVSATLPQPGKQIRSTFREKLGNTFVMTAEIDPPAGLDYQPLIEQAQKLIDLGVDAIQVTDNRLARVRMSSITFAYLLQAATNTEVILHFTCRDRNLLAIQSELMGAAALGIQTIVALTGDPSAVGELPAATSVFDVNSTGLVKILDGLNKGFTLTGMNISVPTNFRIGVSVNPTAPNLELELNKLRQKVDAGADFAQTPPVFDMELLEAFAEKTKDIDIPILIGLLPIKDSKHAEFLHNEVPGMSIPLQVRNRLAEAGNPQQEGIAICSELIQYIKQRFAGIHLVCADNYNAAKKLLEGLCSRAQPA